MPKIVVIAAPEMLPPELADNPDGVMIPPDAVDPDTMAALDAASGGLLAEGEGGGEGPLEDWAKEEEKEPEHGAGRGDDDDDGTSGGDPDPDPDPDPDKRGGSGDDDPDKDEKDKAAAGEGRRHGRGRESGRGRSPLAAWVGRR